MNYKFPSLTSLRSALVHEHTYLRRSFSPSDLAGDDDATPGTDIRLRVFGRNWQLLTGSSDYDTDHRGAWGASFLPYGRTNLLALARELLDDARESYAQMQEGEAWHTEQAERRALLSAGLHSSQTGRRSA
jgi:hypothetical protein